MGVMREIPGKADLEEIAGENGVAVVVVDRAGVEISAANNNSICRSLNPDGILAGACKADCGEALRRASGEESPITYTCHAGLECRAAAMKDAGENVAVIVGRTFLRSDNYRKAGERALRGDWRNFSPFEFFRNILLSGSAVLLDKAMETVIERSVPVEDAVDDNAATFDTTPERSAEVPQPAGEEEKDIAPASSPKRTRTLRPEQQAASANDAAAWRSLFGSLLERDHTSARNAAIEFLATQFHLTSIIWLEKRGDRLESTAVSSNLRTRRVHIGMDADDERLADAVSGEMPIELGKAPTEAEPDPKRVLLFALPVGDDVPAAVVVLDRIDDDEKRAQIARFCHAIAPQIELLRLRAEVSRRMMIDAVTERLTEGSSAVEPADLWLHLTRVSAELLQVERASLITHDEESDRLRVRASVGSVYDLTQEENAGERVARIVFEKGKPVIVKNVSATGLPPADDERRYRTSSFISAPVTLRGKQLGVINFTDKASGDAFDRRDLDMVRAITPQLASLIDRKLLEKRAVEFEQLSVTDPLTGLLNRRYIEQRLAEEVKRSNRHGYPMAYVMLDVDHFKSYNDSFGHPAGDETLRIVAAVIRETLREADVAARVGGEEFAILLPQTRDDEAAAIAERVRLNIAETDFPHREVTVSVGVATCSSDLCTRMDMTAAADKALYKAKQTGRDRVCIYEREAGEKQPA